MNFIEQLKKSFLGFIAVMPMILGIIALVGLFEVFITKQMLSSLFTSNPIKDTIIGTFAGAVAVGQALISYIIGGELLQQGISLYAVSAFILSWVTLGLVQLPAEAEVFGLRFTIYRNILAFIFTIFVSVATVFTLNLLS
jgi:uncharacterized membrane protein YraQ (UPF0718 family)